MPPHVPADCSLGEGFGQALADFFHSLHDAQQKDEETVSVFDFEEESGTKGS